MIASFFGLTQSKRYQTGSQWSAMTSASLRRVRPIARCSLTLLSSYISALMLLMACRELLEWYRIPLRPMILLLTGSTFSKAALDSRLRIRKRRSRFQISRQEFLMIKHHCLSQSKFLRIKFQRRTLSHKIPLSASKAISRSLLREPLKSQKMKATLSLLLQDPWKVWPAHRHYLRALNLVNKERIRPNSNSNTLAFQGNQSKIKSS